jgi:hypothetical protein
MEKGNMERRVGILKDIPHLKMLVAISSPVEVEVL